ncbi:MAG: 23S rRNA (guanosine(2251)-2'-O)-methyltransferase RlmB [Candidatus Firestonebacteria bacterium]
MNRTIFGKNACFEVLRSKSRLIRRMAIAKEMKSELHDILALAKETSTALQYISKKDMDRLAKGTAHQGVIIFTYAKEYVEIEDILEAAALKEEKPFILILDSVQDPHNLGAIIRTAECAGCHGIIIPKQNSVHVTATVEMVSTGATEYMLISMVSNLNYAVSLLKKHNVWITGVEAEAAKEYYNEDYTGGIALVFGGEGEGIRKSLKENCDFLVKLPMKGSIPSLNVSVSAGIMMYEVLRQRINAANKLLAPVKGVKK